MGDKNEAPVFDPELPSGQVVGLPGIRYLQGGEYFSAAGKHVPRDDAQDGYLETGKDRQKRLKEEKAERKGQLKAHILSGGETVVTPEPVAEPVSEVVEPEVVADPEPVDVPKTVVDENQQADNVDLEDVHWTKLRKMVEERGGQYEGKPEAIAFLRGE